MAAARVGRQRDGSVVTPSGQLITPAGTQVEFPGRPLAVAVRPDGRTAALLSGTSIQSGSAPLLTVVNLASTKVVQQFRPSESGVASFGGIVYAPDGRHVYASAIDAVVEASVGADGALTAGRRFLVDQYPTGLAVSSDGATLYAALSTKNTVAIVDLATGKMRAQVAVGNTPEAVLVVGTKLYVANQGGRVAQPGDHTNLSAGTKVVADAYSGAVNNGTVSVIDLKTDHASTVSVGLQPTTLAERKGYVYVANTNSDSVSIIDAARGQVVATFAAEPSPGMGVGSAPNGLAFLPDGRLVVSLGRDDALAVYRVTKPTEPAALEGLLPTGWYPAGVAIDPGGTHVVVANADGIGTLGPVGKSLQELIYNDLGRSVTSHTVTAWRGSASIIPVPDEATLAAGAATVRARQRVGRPRPHDRTRGSRACTGPGAWGRAVNDQEGRVHHQGESDLRPGARRRLARQRRSASGPVRFQHHAKSSRRSRAVGCSSTTSTARVPFPLMVISGSRKPTIQTTSSAC